MPSVLVEEKTLPGRRVFCYKLSGYESIAYPRDDEICSEMIRSIASTCKTYEVRAETRGLGDKTYSNVYVVVTTTA